MTRTAKFWRVLISTVAVISIGAGGVACGRDEKPRNDPAVSPTEKANRPCGFGNSDYCGNHHNNNRNNNSGQHGPVGGGGSHGSSGGGGSNTGGGGHGGGGGRGGHK